MNVTLVMFYDTLMLAQLFCPYPDVLDWCFLLHCNGYVLCCGHNVKMDWCIVSFEKTPLFCPIQPVYLYEYYLAISGFSTSIHLNIVCLLIRSEVYFAEAGKDDRLL